VAGDQPGLTRDQQRLLQAVYDHFHERCGWPKFGEIERALDKGRWPSTLAG
jgi:hypothetical protein